MAGYEFALSSEPSVQDLNIVWAPETGLPTIQTRKSEFGVLAKYKLQDVLQVKNLVDGLYVPPLDQKKQRKPALKDVKETKGPNWYDWVAVDFASRGGVDLTRFLCFVLMCFVAGTYIFWVPGSFCVDMQV